jgi:hypothetical protein
MLARCHPASGTSPSAPSALFDYLCERNAVAGNPVQARKLLDAPPADALKGVRDRAILATLLYHGIHREEPCGLLGRSRGTQAQADGHEL